MKAGNQQGWLIPLMGILWACGPVQQNQLDLNRQHASKQFVIKFSPDQSEASINETFDSLHVRILNRFGSDKLTYQVLVDDPSADEQTLNDVVERLSRQIKPTLVQANYLYSLYDVNPDDAAFTRQYALNNDGSQGGIRNADLGMGVAWERSTGSQNILIGLLDTGVDVTHPDLAANMWQNPGETGVDAEGRDRRTNGIDDDGNGYIDDWQGWDFVDNDNNPNDEIGHGTHCAGIIGAQGNNGIGIAGVNWNTRIVPGKIFKRGVQTDEASIVRGIEYFTQLGVNVSNNSWGGEGSSELMREAIQKMTEQGIIFVAAAGNSAQDLDVQPDYPSSYQLPNMITVAASDRKDMLANFSNFGIRTVDVVAPGVDIYSTLPNNQYASRSGTSMAAPFVTGMTALMMSIYPQETPEQIKRRIVYGSRPVQAFQSLVRSGGVVDFRYALGEDGGIPNVPTLQAIVPVSTQSIRMTWSKAGDDGAIGESFHYEARKANTPIRTEEDWAKAQQVTLLNYIRQGDGNYSAEIQELDVNEVGFIAVRAIDDRGQIGGISQSMAYATVAVPVVYHNHGDDPTGVTLGVPWAIEHGKDGDYFTDNPVGRVGGPQESSMILPEIPIANGGKLILSYRNFLSVHDHFDFAYVDIRVDGGPWHVVEDFTEATFRMVYQELNLTPFLQSGQRFQIRFRIKTDRDEYYQGWRIRSINVFSDSANSSS